MTPSTCECSCTLELSFEARRQNKSKLLKNQVSRSMHDPRMGTSAAHASVINGPVTGGGASRDRTDDLLLAKQALSQLSYGPGYAISERRAPGLTDAGSSRSVHGGSG